MTTRNFVFRVKFARIAKENNVKFSMDIEPTNNTVCKHTGSVNLPKVMKLGHPISRDHVLNMQ